MKKVFLMSVLLLVLSYVSSSADDDTVLAKIGDKKIMMSDFNRMVSYYDAERQRSLEQNPIFKATILQRIVQGMVISKIAKDNGFDKRSDIREQIELLSNDFLAAEYLKKEVIEKITVTEDDRKLYYKTHQEEFKTPEMVRARHILIKVEAAASGDDKMKAKEKAAEILARIKAGEDFAKLASELSDDVGSKTKGGDLGFFPKGKMDPVFEKAVFSLQRGEISDIVETQVGFHIVKMEEKKESVLEPYDKIKDKVKEKVLNDFRKARVDEFAEKAMKDANVELHLEPFLPNHEKGQ